MFCQLDRLRRCLSPRIRRVLDELPETLDETYERTLLDIDDENWTYAHRLFQCIVVAQRPLRAEELAEFLAFKLETGGNLTFEGSWRPENPRDTVLSTCSSLITVVIVDGSPVIQFTHFSVKEYLTSSRIAEGRVSRYYIPLEPAHLFVTQACLSILFQLDEHVTNRSIEEFPLARYAGQYWARHAAFGNVSSHIEDLMKRIFLPNSHHFANWVWIYDTISYQRMLSKGPSLPRRAPLHYAAQHGFSELAEWLITTCSQDVNVSCSSFSTPLHVASSRGRLAVVKVLLKHRADINAGQHGWTPLHLASCFGHHKVVRLLLEHGVDVDFKFSYGETALRLLSEGDGNPDVARVLLEYGADPNVRCISGRDSLYMALWKGHQGLAKPLLEHGADPNTRDDDGQILLHVSCRRGDLKVAQGLLELAVDINSRDNQGRTPLQVALQSGNEQVVQLLLQHGAKRA